MNYKVNFENNKAIHCELVKGSNDLVDYAMVDNVRIIKSLIVNALSEKEALIVATRLVDKLRIK